MSQYQGKRKEYQRIKLVSQLLHSNLDRYVQYVLNSFFLDSKSIKMIFSGDPGLWGGWRQTEPVGSATGYILGEYSFEMLELSFLVGVCVNGNGATPK